VNFRPKARPLVFFAAIVVAACLPGSRAPNVPPQRSLELRGADVSGNVSSRPFGVVFAGPKGDTVDPTEVTIVWNRPMRPLDLAGEEAAPPAKIEPSPQGQWRWLGTSALAFMPEKALPRATRYKVTVPKGTKALDGSTLAEDYGGSLRSTSFAPCAGRSWPWIEWAETRAPRALTDMSGA
jgi:hypothetical protein